MDISWIDLKPGDHAQVEEDRLGGSVHYRWMYSIERYLAFLKQQRIPSNENKSSTSAPEPEIATQNNLIPEWLTDVAFDAKEEVLTIGVDGKYQLVSGLIQSIDIWNSVGVKYFVQFNEFHQPIRKGGHLLVKFLRFIAKMEIYCPIGEKTWHDVDKGLKGNIIKKTREYFVMPTNYVYDKLALQRVGKCWSHNKLTLKSTNFKPGKLTVVQHYDKVPPGHSRGQWKNLVNFWFSEQGKEEEHDSEMMSMIDLWEQAHKRNDGTFLEGTVTEDFLVHNDAACDDRENVETEDAPPK